MLLCPVALLDPLLSEPQAPTAAGGGAGAFAVFAQSVLARSCATDFPNSLEASGALVATWSKALAAGAELTECPKFDSYGTNQEQAAHISPMERV